MQLIAEHTSPRDNRLPLGALLTSVTLTLLLLCSGFAWAQSWIKDPARLHVGAHGQLSCSECHQVTPNDGHPDPSRVNEIPRREMKPGLCYECHTEIQDDLKERKHGRRAVRGQARYNRCTTCHDPHYGYHRGAGQPGKFVSGLPRSKQCGACHEQREALPAPPSEDQACWKCHVNAASGPGADPAKLAPVCLGCHGGIEKAAGSTPVLAGGEADLGAHQELDCAACHQKAARFPHDRQSLSSCLECHQPHDEKTAGGDAHIRVDCQACHFIGLTPTLARGRVAGKPSSNNDQPQTVHKLASMDAEKSCARCHHSGNPAGAADMILPPKGLLCMPCHRATFTLADWPSRIGLGILALGLLMAMGVWLGGSRSGAAAHGHEHHRGFCLGAALKAFILDGLLQRRLWQRSPARGLIHSLIFLPFLLRFLYGMAGLILSLWQPQWQLTQALMDKNHPLTALFFDFTGVMVLCGALLALMRRLRVRNQELRGMPRPDWAAIGLLTGAVLLGFALEAVRIAMTGFPSGSGWALLGAALARAIPSGAGGSLYGYLWYAHAAIWAAFAAYLPFSRMLHVLAAPLVLAGRKGRDHGYCDRVKRRSKYTQHLGNGATHE